METLAGTSQRTNEGAARRTSHFSSRSCRSFFRCFEAKKQGGGKNEGEEGRGAKEVVKGRAGWRNDIFTGAKLRARDGMRMLLIRCASLMSAMPPMQRAMRPPDYDYFSD